MHDQRNYQRITFRTEADIIIADQGNRCDLIDLALQGALFRCENNLALEVGEQAVLSIFLPDSDITLEFKAELIHRHDSFYGFIFISEDDETMGHLRRLLELNFGNGELADKEFSQWLKKGKAQSG